MLVARLARRPGQKEQRYAQLLGTDQPESVPAEPAAADGLDARIAALEERVARLEDLVEQRSGSQPL
jgi:uncharacterized protein YceH (UPF0502 family)